MAPTTTLRIPAELREELARLAAARGTTMVQVVADAVHRLTREQWWQSVHDSLDRLDTDEIRRYHEESNVLDHATGDGIVDA